MEKPPFPEVVDSTFLAHAKACQGKAFMSFMEHWKPKGESVHLVAGKAFARGLEVARKCFWGGGLSPEDSVAEGVVALIKEYGDFEAPEEGPGSNKSLPRIAGAFEYYFDECPLSDSDNPRKDGVPIELPGGGRAIEFSFAEPIDVPHPVTGLPLIYCGRADMIAEWADGVYVWDDKTASQLGASWAQQWDLRSQFSAYTWAARRLGYKVNGVITNGTAVLKTMYKHDRAITGRSNWEIERWYTQTQMVLERLIAAWERWDPESEPIWKALEFNLDESCANYGGCQFRQICKVERSEDWLPMYFEQKVWDPLTRTETPIEEWRAKHAG